MHLIKNFLLFCLFVVGFGLLYYPCHLQTGGFYWDRVYSNQPNDPRWDIPLSAAEEQDLLRILDQPFRYLDHGAQCYVFASEDGKYVLKLLRCHRLFPKPITRWIAGQKLFSLPFLSQLQKGSQHTIEKLHRCFEQTYGSYYAAYHDLKEETALLYLHLNKTPEWGLKIPFYDRIGCLQVVEIGNLLFIVQRRAEPVLDCLKRLVKEGKIEEAHRRIDDLFQLLISRCSKGIFDKDPNPISNFGFLGDKIIQIDIGRYSYDAARKQPEIYSREIRFIATRYQNKLSYTLPVLKDYPLQSVENILKEQLDKEPVLL